jgi:tripartite-type tricarboxylate transporter receptor subunit TctC
VRVSALAALALCAAAATGTVPAQPYPVKPIRFYAAFPAGGASDIIARGLGQRLAEVLGQPVLVDNRSGAGGQIGADAVAKAPPDGYSLLLGASFLVIAPSLYRKLPYDALRDFAPISLVATNQFVLVVHPVVPVRALKDLIALARARPGRLNYASSGAGAPPHLAAELLKSMAKIDVVHVPYKGGVPALADLLGGQVDFFITGIAGVMPYVKSGRLRPLAVTGAKRSGQLRDVPTMAESGLPGYDISTWFGILATAGTPREVVSRLNEVVRGIVAEPATRSFIEAQGIEPLTSGADEFAAFLRAETAKFAKIVKAAGLEPQ